ncbi:hypothetical protein [Streptomyces sp. ODS28]|uniref:hypothetical protein n=1 Tax=Streptomyces sp. ODS28 TaxID=3136688 RepID=UPI0031E5BD6B
MTEEPRQDDTGTRTDTAGSAEHPQAPWWADLGLPGGILLIVLGAALGVSLVLFSENWQDSDTLPNLYGVARVVAIGLVVGGGALVTRRKRAAKGADASTGPEDA